MTFSFPVEQTALDSGKILTWTKGFSAKNAIGNDVVKLLQDAFDRKHMHVKCVALVNDVCRAQLSRSGSNSQPRLLERCSLARILLVDVLPAPFSAPVQTAPTWRTFVRDVLCDFGGYLDL